MTEGVERAVEHVIAGILFCVAIGLLLWLHGTLVQQTTVFGTDAGRLLVSERERE